MSEPDRTPDAYVIAHVREALATDERVAELGIELTIASSTLVLNGRVASTAQRDAATAVATELLAAQLPDLEVRNDLEVVDADAGPAGPEHVT
ncbi:MAG TPA: hypothetical protein VIR58_08500 [Acidimicrobiales bacterium]